MGGGNDKSSTGDDWEQSLFRPPAWPFGDDSAGGTEKPAAYGYDLRALDRLPQQAGTQPRPPSANPAEACDVSAQAYYRQFAVYRRALETTPAEAAGGGRRKRVGLWLRALRLAMLVGAALVVACELAAYVCIRVVCDGRGGQRSRPAAAAEEEDEGVGRAAERLRDARRAVERGGGRRAARRLCGELAGGGLGAVARWDGRAAQQYAMEACAGLLCLRSTPWLSSAEKLALGSSAAQQLGRTALCLSGGASLAWKHLGVARVLLDRGCLPHVLSGASAGSVVAALLATHTDAELRRVLRPQLAKYLTACQDAWPRRLLRWLRTGALFDAVDWAPRAQVFARSLTFAEAHRRTGRTLSIPCAPRGRGPALVLNHVTAPNVLVWSAVLASACLPGILPSTVLLQRTHGRVRVHVERGTWWRDGSFQSDIPGAALRRLFNVGSVVASQVNPHVAWFVRRAGAVGVAHGLLLDVRKVLRWACDLRVLPEVCGQDWSRVWLQRFHGDVTVLPEIRVRELAGLLSDPSVRWLEGCFAQGARAMARGVDAVGARRAVEDAVDGLLDDARAAEASARALHARVDSGVDHGDDDDDDGDRD